MILLPWSCKAILQNAAVSVKRPLSNMAQGFFVSTSRTPPSTFSKAAYKIYIPEERRTYSFFWRPFLFATGFTLATFTLTSIWEYENMKKKWTSMARKKSHQPSKNWWEKLFSYFPSFDGELKTRSKNNNISMIDEWIAQCPSSVRHWIGESKHFWSSLSASDKTLATIIFINLVVFGAWRIPSWRSFMEKHFLHSLLSPSYTLLTSNFSHMTPLHFAFNMFALWSFGSFIHQQLGREQFVFLYLTAGVWSSFASHLFKLSTKSLIPSLGASGAICSLLGVTAHFPFIKMGIIFLPFVSIPAPMAVLGLMAFDIYGLVSKKFSLDHVGHLSGTVIGYIYFWVGRDYIWASRHHWLDLIHYPK